MTGTGTALATLAVGAGALAQSVSGIGFALVCGPFLVAILGAGEGIRVAVLLSAVVNVALLVLTPRGVRWRDCALLLAPAALSTPALALLLRRLDPRAAALAAGLSTLTGVALLASGRRWARAAGAAGAVAAGVASAAMNVTASIGGPAAALYAENAGWPPRQTGPTLQLYFLGLNLVALASLGVPPVPVPLVAGLVVGALLGAAVSRRLPAGTARRATLAIAAAGGLTVVVQSLT